MDIHAIDEKSGLPVVEVLRSKHPPERILDDFDDLGEAPPLPKLDISQEIVERVAKTMGGATGPGGVDASQLQLWLKQYGGYSKSLREEVALFDEWMANDTPPWAAI